MELKHLCKCERGVPVELLIVPYGIETQALRLVLSLRLLLIVPYGIETFMLLSLFLVTI